ncbi:FecR family protein [Pseudomonas sp. ABC1]|uniref:FecR family protein n=1 Tax=Pseudomonas sp. ABC1 TaxID=2748080 RepID=UPI0015C3682B|nr:FecR family protein [Pseudomonas sp. ABC1]QLF93757.1 FecR family protein [Pseudomonas sp. ABC1]
MSELDRIREEAATWLVRLGDEQSAETQDACHTWRQADPRHEQVYRQMEMLWNGLPPSTPTRPGKRIATSLAVLAVLLAGAYTVQPAHWLADQRTVLGEVRQITLEDGSRITLDSRSAINIHYDERERRIELLRGELLAEVRPDPQARPFRVVSRDGTAQALGTRYLVRQETDSSLAQVLESKIRVSPERDPQQAVTVEQGQRLRFDRERPGRLEAAESDADAWTRHRLVFRDVPLTEVLESLERYRPGWLSVDTQAIATLRFTGVLPSNDTDAALQTLERSLPIRVRTLTPWLVRVSR